MPLVFPKRDEFFDSTWKKGVRKTLTKKLFVKLFWLFWSKKRGFVPWKYKYNTDNTRKSSKRQRVENLQLNFRRWKGYSRSSSIEKGQLKGRGAGEGETDARTRELKKNIRACTNCWLTRQAWLLPFANGDASPRRLDPFVINVDS